VVFEELYIGGQAVDAGVMALQDPGLEDAHDSEYPDDQREAVEVITVIHGHGLPAAASCAHRPGELAGTAAPSAL
jgi:hypothetical protein